MLATAHFVELVVFTLFGVGIALSMEWVLLTAVLQTIKPATAKRLAVPAKTGIADGTARLARAYASHR